MYQLVDVTQFIERSYTKILNINFLMIRIILNKFIVYKNLVMNLFRIVHIIKILIFKCFIILSNNWFISNRYIYLMMILNIQF